VHSISLRYFNAVGADESGEIGEMHDPETHLIPLALAASTANERELQIYAMITRLRTALASATTFM